MNVVDVKRRKLLWGAAAAVCTASATFKLSATTSTKLLVLVADNRFVNDADYLRIRNFWGGERIEKAFDWDVQRWNSPVGDSAQLKRLVDRIKGNPPHLVAVAGEPEALAINKAAPTTRLIFGSNVDPDEIGLTTLNRQDGEFTTGFTFDDVRYVKPIALAADCCDLFAVRRRVTVVAEPAWLSENRIAIWRQEAGRCGAEIAFHTCTTFSEAIEAIGVVAANGVRVCVTPHSQLTVLSSAALANLFRNARIVQIAERFENLVVGAPLAYEDTFSDWQPTMGQMVRMVMEGERIFHIPVRRPDAWTWGVNLRSLSFFDIGVPSRILDELDVAIEQ